jgi:hypothetical protein
VAFGSPTTCAELAQPARTAASPHERQRHLRRHPNTPPRLYRSAPLASLELASQYVTVTHEDANHAVRPHLSQFSWIIDIIHEILTGVIWRLGEVPDDVDAHWTASGIALIHMMNQPEHGTLDRLHDRHAVVMMGGSARSPQAPVSRRRSSVVHVRCCARIMRQLLRRDVHYDRSRVRCSCADPNAHGMDNNYVAPHVLH